MLRLSPTTTPTPPTAMATTERGLLMPRPRLSPTTPTATPPTVDMPTTERGLLMPRPRLSPTTTPTPPTAMATTERGLPRPRLSPTMPMATQPMATPTGVKIVQPVIDLIATSNHRACFNINLVTITYQKMFCSLQ